MNIPAAHAADPNPCPPPSISAAGGTTSQQSGCGAIQSAPSGEFGPTQIANGQCPRIPTSFPKTYTVASEAEFASAYASVNPGEAIIIKDGNYTWSTDVFLSKNGTAQNPIYITNNSARFRFTGSFNVFGGFTFVHPTDRVAEISGPDNRVACNTMSDGTAVYVNIANPSADRAEIDNNVFDGNSGTANAVVRCNPTESTCTNNPLGLHFHHNTYKNKPYAGTNGNEAIKLGSGWDPAEGVPTFNVDGNNLDAIIENNLFDGWDGEDELVSVKGDHNIIRNNCVLNSPHAYMVNRLGNNNLWTGNWLDGMARGLRISGRGNTVVFNYIRPVNGPAPLKLMQGQLFQDGLTYAYKDASDSVISHNVFAGVSRMVEVMNRIGGLGTFVAAPNNNS